MVLASILPSGFPTSALGRCAASRVPIIAGSLPPGGARFCKREARGLCMIWGPEHTEQGFRGYHM